MKKIVKKIREFIQKIREYFMKPVENQYKETKDELAITKVGSMFTVRDERYDYEGNEFLKSGSFSDMERTLYDIYTGKIKRATKDDTDDEDIPQIKVTKIKRKTKPKPKETKKKPTKKKTNDPVMEKIKEFMKPFENISFLKNERQDGITVFKDPFENLFHIFQTYYIYGIKNERELMSNLNKEDVVKYLYGLDTGAIKLTNPVNQKD